MPAPRLTPSAVANTLAASAYFHPARYTLQRRMFASQTLRTLLHSAGCSTRRVSSHFNGLTHWSASPIPAAPFCRRAITMASNGGEETAASGAENEIFTYDGKDYKGVREGKATILVPASAVSSDKGKSGAVQQVFYNPIQQFNRDLSVLAIRAHGEEWLEKRKESLEQRKANPGGKRKDKKRRRPQGDETAERPAKEATEATKEPETKDTKEEAGQPDTPPKFTILDALSASGLRALRYSHELPFVTSVTANDLTKSATESIKLNAKHNGLEDKIQVTHDDAIAHMYRRIADDLSDRDSRGKPGKKNKYNVIDLDPYGTASPFLDAAVQSVRDDGGLLCVTCTDASHWAGHCYAEKSFSLYGGVPIRGSHTHEVGLRLVLQSIATAAARHGLHIEPVLSLSIDFYCRLWVRVRHNPSAISFLGGKTMLMYQCSGCSSWETQTLVRTKVASKKKGTGHFFKHGLGLGPPTDQQCRHCDSKMHIAGPMYGGPLHNAEFVQRMLDLLPTADKAVYGTLPRIEGMLTTALEELLPGPEPQGDLDPKDIEMAKIDHYPFFVVPSVLAGTLNSQSIPEALFRGALAHLGYRATRSHCKAGSIKTDAPFDTIWFIMREYVRQKAPVRLDRIKPGSPAYKLLGLDVAKAEESKTEGTTESTAEEAKETEEKQPEAQEVEMKDVEAQEGATELSSEAELRKTLVFDDALARLGREKGQRKLVRYQFNPTENWGPMTRAAGNAMAQAPSSEFRTLRRRDNGQLVYTADDGEVPIPTGEIICILSRASRYILVRLKEIPDEAETPYRLHTHVIDDADKELLDKHLVQQVPEFLQDGHELHIVVSTKSGTGLALKFWEAVVKPLLALLAGEEEQSKGVPDDSLLITESAQSVKDFAKSRWARKHAASNSETASETIILLSGDGGVVDLLNGSDDETHTAAASTSLPTIALLPLGTANALFHSLHKPIYTSIAQDGPDTPPSPLALALRTLIRGRPAPLPSFRAGFTPGSRLVSYSVDEGAANAEETSIRRHDTAVSHLYGAIVASHGFHAQLVWESDTPEYRRHGSNRFGMVAAELLRESHAYRAQVSVSPSGASAQEKIITPPASSTTEASSSSFSYILATLVSNLERTFTISPASRPLENDLRLVHFGDVGGTRTMDIMKAAYDEGKHIGLPDVGYESVGGLTVRILEEDARWRKVCIDGTIVEIPQGGEMRVSKVEGALFGVLVDEVVLAP
ncbi:S-adenosyl-L-methionine-dependent methyltransferase [Plectosphaerella plurivora]|uniref:tRNA (guanine(26)-N(2))-dimethyltransferase n=1 Tax=Plectosphaerella plurivora TaxID=936078 RepID=A0A9P8VBV4_9PEZI|nr:S-adenosyl-L-methionine-dependent methyltransferase [Plectosphaerella plurivora]